LGFAIFPERVRKCADWKRLQSPAPDNSPRINVNTVKEADEKAIDSTASEAFKLATNFRF
jgi:hypothetical protein